MLRFVDLTVFYWFGGQGDVCDRTPVCAFIDTTTNRFLTQDGSEGDWQIFECLEDVAAHPRNNQDPHNTDRLVRLLPDGFFDHRGDQDHRATEPSGPPLTCNQS